MKTYKVKMWVELLVDGEQFVEVYADDEDQAEEKVIELMKQNMLDDEIVENIYNNKNPEGINDWDIEEIEEVDKDE